MSEFLFGSPGSEKHEGDFALLLEDLSVHSRVFDQVEDNPDAVASERIALDVAAMHAQYWRAPELDREPILGGSSYEFPMGDACRESPSRLSDLERAWKAQFGRNLFRDEGTKHSEELTRLLCGPDCDRIIDRICEVFSSRPQTLLHGDLRADNIFRTYPTAAGGDAPPRITYIDWQLFHSGPAGSEFSQAWMSSLPPAERRKDRSILRSYHERLTQLNPEANTYAHETVVDDYVLGCVLWWAAYVTVGANALSTEGVPPSSRMKRLWATCVPWVLIALEDHDALGRVRRLLDDDVRPRSSR